MGVKMARFAATPNEIGDRSRLRNVEGACRARCESLATVLSDCDSIALQKCCFPHLSVAKSRSCQAVPNEKETRHCIR